MHPSLAATGHRPWPLPKSRWKWRQTWRKLAFIHYRIEPRKLAAFIPPPLNLESFDGSAWLSVVPFEMFEVAPRWMPPVPSLSHFPELNIRTYVVIDGRPGVWFFSLDADSWPVVLGGRWSYGVPYFKAGMQISQTDGGFLFTSVRRGGTCRFRARYQPIGPTFHAEPGSFEHWISERYCLYSSKQGRVHRVDVHHPPWPLQAVSLEIDESSMLQTQGLSPSVGAPICYYSPGVDVVSFGPVRAGDRCPLPESV